MDKMLISVIVPIYNTSSYLKRCIDSIVNQTYRELEIILVNDGSTDESLDVCKVYEARDGRIVLVDKKNEGVSAARNDGLRIAKGEWISFVDSDDFLDLDFYETLLQGVKESNADVVCCRTREIEENGNEVPHFSRKESLYPTKSKLMEREEVYRHFFVLSNQFIFWSPFDKLFKADIAKTIQFKVGYIRAEDFFYCFSFFQKMTALYYIPQKKYNYFRRKDSVTQKEAFDSSFFNTPDLAKEAVSWLDRDVSATKNMVEYAKMNCATANAKVIKAFYLDPHIKYMKRIDALRNELRNNKKIVSKLSLKYMLLCFLSMYAPNVYPLLYSRKKRNKC